MARLKRCALPGCPDLVVSRGRCARHATSDNRQYHDPARKALYNSREWKIIRPLVLARDPICRICGQYLSTEVDHVLAVQDGGEPLSMGNLQGACHECHARKTQLEVSRRRSR